MDKSVFGPLHLVVNINTHNVPKDVSYMRSEKS